SILAAASLFQPKRGTMGYRLRPLDPQVAPSGSCSWTPAQTASPRPASSTRGQDEVSLKFAMTSSRLMRPSGHVGDGAVAGPRKVDARKIAPAMFFWRDASPPR